MTGVFQPAPYEDERLPLREDRPKGRGWVDRGSQGAVFLSVLLPWLVFMVVSLAFMLLYRFMAEVVITLAIVAAGLCLAFAVISRKRGGFDRAHVLVCCMLAVICGAVAGSYNYYINSRNYFAYNDHWQYTNVDPTEPAGAHRDASAIVFESGAKPSVKLSIGYARGYHQYCVAPIIDMSEEMNGPKIEYWAVGSNCCGGEGFTCDDAGKDSARSGLVLFNRSYAFHSLVTRDIDMYAKAIEMACAKFSLVCEPDPIYVRWVQDLEAARYDSFREAWLTWLEAGVGFLPFCALLGFGVPGLRRWKM